MYFPGARNSDEKPGAEGVTVSAQQPLKGERFDKVTRLSVLQSGFRPTSVWLQNLFYSMDSAFPTKSQEVSKDRGRPRTEVQIPCPVFMPTVNHLSPGCVWGSGTACRYFSYTDFEVHAHSYCSPVLGVQVIQIKKLYRLFLL